jgi:Holliday junction resolvase
VHNAKPDRNQKEIVKALREAGFSVQDLRGVGKGFPDLLVGYFGSNYLIEVKDGLKSKLNEDQVEWHENWKGQVITIHDMLQLNYFINHVKLGL